MTIRMIRALFLDGIELSLWGTARECADLLDFEDEKFRRSWMSEGGIPGELENARTKLIARIDGTRGTVPAPIIPPIRQLYVEGLRQELWTMRTDCAVAIGLSADTLSKYMDRQKTDCAGPREVTQFNEMQAELKKKLRPQKKTAAEDSQPKDVAEVAPPVAAPPGTAHWSNSLLDELAARVALRLQETYGGTGLTPGPSMPSDWIDEVIAGQRELIGQSTPGCRFVIARAETIVPLVKGFTTDERKDTAHLAQILTIGIRELRRRLTLSSQMASVADRTDDLKILGGELDMLVVGIEQSSDVNLGATATLRQAERMELQNLRKTLNGGEKP